MVSVATFTVPLSSAASQASQFAAAQWNKVPTVPSFAEAKSAISSVPLSTYGIGAGVIAGATALGFGAKYAYDRYSAASAYASAGETLESDSAKDARSLTLFGWVPEAISSRAQSSWTKTRELVGLGPKASAEAASSTEEVSQPEVTEIREAVKSGIPTNTATAPVPMKTGHDLIKPDVILLSPQVTRV